MSGFGPAIFRKRALEQSSVVQELDHRVRVVTPPRWLALAIAVLVVAGLIAWAGSTEVQTTVDASGVISPIQGFQSAASPVAGVVTKVPPGPGTAVRPGEVIATIDTGRPPLVRVRALADGRIGTVAAKLGSYVAPGRELATVEPLDAVPAVFLAVPARDASEITPGKQVLVAPGTEESEAKELLKGRVVGVDPYAVSRARLTALFGSERAQELAGDDPLQLVEVKLLRDPSTPSGYAWTHGKGLPSIRVGTPLTARIVLSKQSPLGSVFG